MNISHWLLRFHINHPYFTLSIIKRLTLIFTIISLLVIAFFWSYQGKEAPHPSSSEQEMTIKAVGASGRIVPRSDIIKLSFDADPLINKVSKLLVTEGMVVKAGDEIAYLNDYDYKFSALDIAKKNVALLKIKLKSEEYNKDFYYKQLNRSKKLEKTSVISEHNLDVSEKEYKNLENSVEYIKQEIALAESNVNLVAAELAQSVLLAPFDGTIVKINTKAGETVSESGVVEIADLSKFDVIAEVHEQDISKVSVGAKAYIFVPGFEEPFEGKVVKAGFKVEQNENKDSDPFSDQDQKIVEVRIELGDGSADKLKHLSFVQVTLRIE